jgi:HSP20 family protein
MAIQRWDPLRDLLQIQERMNKLFEDVLARSAGGEGPEALDYAGWKPPVDVVEHHDRYLLRADIPGVTVEEVELEVEDGTLVLRGERKPDPSVSREAYLRAERPHGRFALQLALPPSVDPKGIRAAHGNGVLEVVLPKRREDVPSRIKVPVQ